MSFKGKALAACQKYLRDYLRTVAAIDEGVGLLMHELETQGDLDNTLIIYTSDQGMFLGEHDYQDKRWSYEESLRAPFLVRFPPEIAAGSVSDQLMANIDIAPTLLDYANIDIPDSMQGRSLRKCLSDPCEKGRDAVYFRYWMHLAHRHQNPAHFGIRSTEWKLICYYGLPLDANGAVQVETPGGWELYNLKSDPYEMHNLHDKAEYTPVIKKLKKRLFELRKQYQDTDDQYPQLLEKITEMS